MAQTINDSDLLHTPQIRFLSVVSQNDLYKAFNRSDKYFTNGIHIQYGDKALNNKVSRFLLFHPLKESKSHFALAFGQDIYTPLNVYLHSVDSSDIPYSGTLYFTYSRQSNNHKKGIKLESKLFLGLQGPAAGADDAQLWFHEFSNDPIPKGWHNQIANGLILDYEVNYERLLPIISKHLEFTTNALAHVGTFQNFVQVGVGMKVGLFNYSFSSFGGMPNSFAKSGTYTTGDIRWSKKKKHDKKGKEKYRKTAINSTWQVYGFTSINAGVMFYDGSVQGSLIPFEESPYLYSHSDYQKANGNFEFGLTLSYKNLLLQLKRVTKRDVYKGTGTYGWGEIKGVFSF
jgi:hypothetical protein